MKIRNHEEYVLACEELRVMVSAIEAYNNYNEVNAELMAQAPDYKSMDLSRNDNRVQPHDCETHVKGSLDPQVHPLDDSGPRGYKFFSQTLNCERGVCPGQLN
jgi:hypothetical protein